MSDDKIRDACCEWWRTSITDMAPDRIRHRGYAAEDLIGNAGFADMVWLMLRGDLPGRAEAGLLEAALVSGVDHGPQAPSVAIARMTATCGVGLNNVLGSAVNVLGDVHGGAGEQTMGLLHNMRTAVERGVTPEKAVDDGIAAFHAAGGKYVPGYGHRFHKKDPRAPRLMALADEAAATGAIKGDVIILAREIERQISGTKGRPIPMNIDGATAALYCELGFPAPLARGLFCLSRSVGILAHGWEQMRQGERNKGPMPKELLWRYDGEPDRNVPDRD